MALDYYVSTYNNLNANEEHYCYNVNIVNLVVNDSDVITISDNNINMTINVNVLSNRVVFQYELTAYNYKNSAGRNGNALSYYYISSNFIKNNGVYNPLNEVGVQTQNYINYESAYAVNGVSMIIDTWYSDSLNLTDEEYDNIWQNGFDEGYNYGVSDGRQIGYNEGVTAGNTGEFDGVFTLLGTAFDSAGGLMSTNIIGGITIGTFIMIPIGITILVAILKMLRK